MLAVVLSGEYSHLGGQGAKRASLAQPSMPKKFFTERGTHPWRGCGCGLRRRRRRARRAAPARPCAGRGNPGPPCAWTAAPARCIWKPTRPAAGAGRITTGHNQTHGSILHPPNRGRPPRDRSLMGQAAWLCKEGREQCISVVITWLTKHMCRAQWQIPSSQTTACFQGQHAGRTHNPARVIPSVRSWPGSTALPSPERGCRHPACPPVVAVPASLGSEPAHACEAACTMPPLAPDVVHKRQTWRCKDLQVPRTAGIQSPIPVICLHSRQHKLQES